MSFFFNATATTEIYTLSLHDALPISDYGGRRRFPALVSGRFPELTLPNSAASSIAEAMGDGTRQAGKGGRDLMTAVTASALSGGEGTAIRRIAFWTVLVALADFLLYGHAAGWVEGLVYLLLLSLAAMNTPSAITRPYGRFLLGACALMCLAMVESANGMA